MQAAGGMCWGTQLKSSPAVLFWKHIPSAKISFPSAAAFPTWHGDVPSGRAAGREFKLPGSFLGGVEANQGHPIVVQYRRETQQTDPWLRGADGICRQRGWGG